MLFQFHPHHECSIPAGTSTIPNLSICLPTHNENVYSRDPASSHLFYHMMARGCVRSQFLRPVRLPRCNATQRTRSNVPRYRVFRLFQAAQERRYVQTRTFGLFHENLRPVRSTRGALCLFFRRRSGTARRRCPRAPSVPFQGCHNRGRVPTVPCVHGTVVHLFVPPAYVQIRGGGNGASPSLPVGVPAAPGIKCSAYGTIPVRKAF